MRTFACVLFKANSTVPDYSHCYDSTWVDKLHRAIARHTPKPWEFVCFTDRDYDFTEPVTVMRLEDPHHDWQSCMEPFRLPGTVLMMGLDTLVVGDLSDLLTYTGPLALTKGRDHDSLSSPKVPGNGVMLFNDGPAIYKRFREDPDRRKSLLGSYPSELAWLRKYYRGQNQSDYVDDLFPGQVLDYRWHVLRGAYDPAKVRIVYFAGRCKPHNMFDHKDVVPDFLKNVWY